MDSKRLSFSKKQKLWTMALVLALLRTWLDFFMVRQREVVHWKPWEQLLFPPTEISLLHHSLPWNGFLVIPRKSLIYTQNIQINKVIGENEKWVFYLMEKTQTDILANPIIFSLLPMVTMLCEYVFIFPQTYYITRKATKLRTLILYQVKNDCFHTRISMFIAELFSKANKWKQSKRPSTGE